MARLKHSDLKNKNKILMKVNWTKLKDNKKPYLSVDVDQVIMNGKRITDRRDQSKAIKIINSDFSFLLDCHLCDHDGYKMHMIANGLYFWKLTKDHTIEKPITVEDHQVKIDQCFTDLSYVYDQLFRLSRVNKLEYNTFFDRLKRGESVTSFIRWLLHNQIGFTNSKKLKNDLENKIDLWKKAKDQYQYKTLPRLSEIWSLDRFSEYSDLSIDYLQRLFFEDDQTQINLLTEIFNRQATENEKRLNKLTDLYNIGTLNK